MSALAISAKWSTTSKAAHWMRRTNRNLWSRDLAFLSPINATISTMNHVEWWCWVWQLLCEKRSNHSWKPSVKSNLNMAVLSFKRGYTKCHNISREQMCHNCNQYPALFGPAKTELQNIYMKTIPLHYLKGTQYEYACKIEKAPLHGCNRIWIGQGCDAVHNPFASSLINYLLSIESCSLDCKVMGSLCSYRLVQGFI